jgi:hypothetical protein
VPPAGVCLIGGLAINHYVEPVVTLDADFALAASGGVADALQRRLSVEEFPHSLNALFPAAIPLPTHRQRPLGPSGRAVEAGSSGSCP